MSRPRLVSVLWLGSILAFVSGCATHRFTPPSGPPLPVPAAEAAASWDEASRPCATVHSYNAQIRPSGRVAESRVRGLTLFVGVDDQGRLGIEAEGGNRPVFTLKGTTDEATLWLPPENRVVVAAADRMLEAIVGLELGAERLLALLSGCVASDRTLARADRLGNLLRVTTADAVLYLEKVDGRWTVRAGEFGAVAVQYPERDGEWPRRIVVQTVEGRTPAVDLTLNVTDRRINPTFPAGTFVIAVPPGAVPAAVEDLRLIGSD